MTYAEKDTIQADTLAWVGCAACNWVFFCLCAPGAISLLHHVHSTTADALPTLFTTLEKEGYRFLTVSEPQSKLAAETASPFYGNMKKG